MFEFYKYCLNQDSLGDTTLERMCQRDSDFYIRLLDDVENKFVKTDPFMGFLNERGHLDLKIKENAICFSASPLAYVLAMKKFPDHEFPITKEGN